MRARGLDEERADWHGGLDERGDDVDDGCSDDDAVRETDVVDSEEKLMDS